MWTALSLVAACASGQGDGGSGDDDAGAPVIDATPLGDIGDECSADEECASGLCADKEIEGGGFCTADCGDGCPAGYACAADGSNLCRPSLEHLCSSCESDADCGGENNRCIDYEGGSFCAADCSNGSAECPTGFSCEAASRDGQPLGLLCVADNDVCCIDGDGDFRGIGDGCRATDCNDEDPDIFDDAQELCDGKDNQCDGTTDQGVVDCAPAECRLGSNGFLMQAAESCLNATCTEMPEVLCGLYTCSEGGAEGDVCATSCDGEDDSKCNDSAHCDGSQCLANLPDANSCDEDSDCQSGHCQNGFCCAFGDCCQVASDCPSFGSFEPVCEDPATCQGTRGEAVCTVDAICGTTGDVQDDSACDSQTVADECGFFKSVFCTGQLNQDAPSCATSCSSDADCDANAYCNDQSECVADEDNGGACEGDSQCISGHCQNGFCCDDGDCCESAVDCPAAYSSDASCDVESACQGTRDIASCVNSECQTVPNSPDDSACDSGTLSDECGPYPSIFCNGALAQDEPVCATSCVNDSDCDANAYCNSQSQCEFDEPDGSTCTGDAQCISGHCENGFCCADGDCCFDDNDCNHLDIAPVCDDQTTCQGTRVDGVCTGSFQCITSTAGDDSACSGLPSNDCGPYQGIECNGSTNQSSNQASLCATTCSSDADCDASAHCDGNECVPDQGVGGFCTNNNDCGGGLSCVDNVCCTSSCTGSCEACDLPGSEGTCTQVASGEDPDLECGAQDCSSFYFGWEGDTCFTKADVNAAAATCSGSGSCSSQADECTAQTARGSAETTCNATCQEPNLATCTGTTPGSCTNLDLGTETCGQGACQVTVDKCVNGAPQSCTPNTGAASSETCNGIDDDCNGLVDDGLPADDFESNNSCTSHFFLGTLGEGETSNHNDMTLYTSGDEDWFRELTSEAFTTCTTGVDEEYEYVVTMIPPTGQDYDLEVCFNSFDDSSCTTDCFDSFNGGDQAETVGLTWAGPCGGGTNDGLNFFIRVYPFAGASSCEPYQLSTEFRKTN